MHFISKKLTSFQNYLVKMFPFCEFHKPYGYNFVYRNVFIAILFIFPFHLLSFSTYNNKLISSRLNSYFWHKLTYFTLLVSFCKPWKYQKTFVFWCFHGGGYRKRAAAWNELILIFLDQLYLNIYFIENQKKSLV